MIGLIKVWPLHVYVANLGSTFIFPLSRSSKEAIEESVFDAIETNDTGETGETGEGAPLGNGWSNMIGFLVCWLHTSKSRFKSSLWLRYVVDYYC